MFKYHVHLAYHMQMASLLCASLLQVSSPEEATAKLEQAIKSKEAPGEVMSDTQADFEHVQNYLFPFAFGGKK